MRFTRDTFSPDAMVPQPALPHARLRSGLWLVEAGARPPASHRPARLLADRAGDGGIAISLRSATALRSDPACGLVRHLAAEGCEVGPLATVALHELVLNAAIHGNLEVASGRPGAWHDLAARVALIAAALQDPVRAARVVTVALGWNAGQVAAVVADQGAGYRAVVSAGAASGERLAAGRGLMIARAAGQLDVLRGGRCTRLVFPRMAAAEG